MMACDLDHCCKNMPDLCRISSAALQQNQEIVNVPFLKDQNPGPNAMTACPCLTTIKDDFGQFFPDTKTKTGILYLRRLKFTWRSH